MSPVEELKRYARTVKRKKKKKKKGTVDEEKKRSGVRLEETWFGLSG